MENNYVTIEEFKQQVWEIEGVKIHIEQQNNYNYTVLVKSYPYKTALNGDFTIDDLMTTRVIPCLDDCKYPNSVIITKL